MSEIRSDAPSLRESPDPQLRQLLSRVEAATGPDRELDGALAVRLAGFTANVTYGHELLGNLHTVPAHAPRYTGSVDATLALVERLLGRDAAEVLAQEAFGSTRFVQPLPAAFALALLAALLRARLGNGSTGTRKDGSSQKASPTSAAVLSPVGGDLGVSQSCRAATHNALPPGSETAGGEG